MFPGFLCIHPGWKQPVAARLLRGALSVAYGMDSTTGPGYSTGPTLKRATFAQGGVTLAFQTTGASPTLAFYANPSSEFDLSFDGGATWHPNVKASLAKSTASCVTLVSPMPPTQAPTHVRYLWSKAPGTHPHNVRGRTTVYSAAEDLPVTPFIDVVVAL